ncbi:hypothetical protein CPC08DRAFT_698334 [Agrocybe pediades]|nr:hypothetical protein CPC08DRAFT_698334 [Agrocybe pediades]
MFFKTTVASVVAAIAIGQASAAALVAKSSLDVFVPRIISPNAATVWTVGQQEVVTWDASDAPASISNFAAVVLDRNFTAPLAAGFDLRAGNVTVVVPNNVVPGSNHVITLFGDSGNISPKFTIVAA